MYANTNLEKSIDSTPLLLLFYFTPDVTCILALLYKKIKQRPTKVGPTKGVLHGQSGAFKSAHVRTLG